MTGTAGVQSPPSLPSTVASRPTVAPRPSPAALTTAQLKTRAQQKLDQVPTRLSAASPTRQGLKTVGAGPSGCDAIPGGFAYVHLLECSLTDRAGRTGVSATATATADDIRFLLILKPSTGELLAYERAALTPPVDSDRIGAFVDDYHLFLVHTHTTSSDNS
ncbi:hypothetical protein [Micromonospora sp. M61]|uniref:hypothetical protein n=1 Tax=Micromonospora sp. M61 TaxID=2824890 RepID=UPI001B36E4B3|nr:hypothetical protein [Micromonospora sp. M61]MBQ0977851.1 hypothetical protein [Micromonospora sp. M61]